MDLDPDAAAAKVRDLEERVRASSLDLGAREALGWALTELARSVRDLGDKAAAERTFRRALEVRDELARRSGTREARRDLARTNTDLGWLIESIKRTEEAHAFYRSALALREALHAETPEDPEATAQLASTLRDLASNAREKGRNAEAQAFFARAAALVEALARTTPESEDRVDLLDNLAWTKRSEAWLLDRLGRAREAEVSIRRAVAIYEELLRDQPVHRDRALWQTKLGGELTYLGGWLEKADRFEEAEAALTGAVAALDEGLLAELTPGSAELATMSLVEALRVLEVVLHNQGRRDEARAARRRGQSVARRLRRS